MQHKMCLMPLVGGIVMLTGCATISQPTMSPEGSAFVAGKSGSLQPYYSQTFLAGERNAVLNFNRMGVAALVNRDYATAQKAFDQSILRIQSIRTGGAGIEAAKSKFSNESSKDFKGEPYEKGMAYYYRGLLYLQAGDFDNAAASFAQVNVEDSVAEDQSYQADFGSMKFLQSWALGCRGEKATSADLYQQAVAMRPSLNDVSPGAPNLVIVETGNAPVKVGSGEHQEKLSWTDGGGVEMAVQVSADAQAAPSNAVMAEDLFYQATTRGGRPVEFILAGKATFRENATNAANVSGVVAQAAMLNSTMQSYAGNYDGAVSSSYVSLASSLFSLVSSTVANATTPEADTRAWESIPRNIWVATLPSRKGSAFDPNRVTASTSVVSSAPQMTAQSRGCSVSWIRLAPVPAPTVDARESIDDSTESKQRDAALQGELISNF